jgi:hypothetical protein
MRQARSQDFSEEGGARIQTMGYRGKGVREEARAT